MVDTSAFDQPEARGLRLIVATLRVVVAAQCFGAAILRFVNAGESNIAILIAKSQEAELSRLVTIDQVTGGLLVACGMFSLTRPCWPVLGPLMLYFVCESVAKLGQGESWLLYIEPVEHAARICAPMALMLIDWFPPAAKFSLWRFMTTGSIIRTAAACTFAGHGLVALENALNGGHFHTLVQDASWFLLDRSLPDAIVSMALAIIGSVDVAVAFNLLLTRSRSIAAWMVFWGFITAGSRIFHYPAFEGIGQMLVRFANGGAPLVVFLYWTLAVREREHMILPKGRRENTKKPA